MARPKMDPKHRRRLSAYRLPPDLVSERPAVSHLTWVQQTEIVTTAVRQYLARMIKRRGIEGAVRTVVQTRAAQ